MRVTPSWADCVIAQRRRSQSPPGLEPRGARPPTRNEKAGRGHPCPAPRHTRHQDKQPSPSRLSSVTSNPAITQGPHTAVPLPCRTSAGVNATPTRRTLPVFSDTCPITRAPGITPGERRRPSQVSGDLRPAGHVASSTRAAHPPRTSGASPQRSFRYHSYAVAISVGRTQKLRPTHRVWDVRISAPSPSGLTGKRFVSRLSWLSSSRPPFHRAVPG